MKVYENELRALSKLKTNLESEILEKYEIKINDSDLACVDIRKSENAFEVFKIFNENEIDEGPGVWFLKRFKLEMENEDEELFLYNKQLFEPKFEALGFCVSKINFFVEKYTMYSVEMDYDFDRSITISINKFISEEKELKLFFKEVPLIFEDILNGIKGNEIDEE